MNVKTPMRMANLSVLRVAPRLAAVAILGVFGLADAGRVYFDGESPGGWHTSYGGGVWFSSLGHALSLAYAKGETGRLYLRLGMPL